MPSKKESTKGNKPADRVNGIHTPELTPDMLTETEIRILDTTAGDDWETDGVRIAGFAGDLPDNAPEDAYTAQDAERLLLVGDLLELVRNEQYPGGYEYGLYRLAASGQEFYEQVNELAIQRERAAWQAEREAKKASAQTLTHWEHVKQLGDLDETEFSMLSAFLGALESKRTGKTVFELVDTFNHVQPSQDAPAPQSDLSADERALIADIRSGEYEDAAERVGRMLSHNPAQLAEAQDILNEIVRDAEAQQREVRAAVNAAYMNPVDWLACQIFANCGLYWRADAVYGEGEKGAAEIISAIRDTIVEVAENDGIWSSLVSDYPAVE